MLVEIRTFRVIQEPVILLPHLLILQDIISIRDLDKHLLGFGIIRVLVRMEAEGEGSVSLFDPLPRLLPAHS